MKLMDNKLGQFIVFEGLDGAGRSTQVELLCRALTADGYDILSTKEPTVISEPGKKIKQILRGEIIAFPEELQELFSQDRAWHLETMIEPHLRKSEKAIVVSDRYFFSSFAFGSACGAKLEWLFEINKDFLLPDMLFFVEVSPEICMKRIESRGYVKELMERRELLEKVSVNYQNILKSFHDKTKIIIINGEEPIETIAQKIYEKFSQNY
ncbi:MAG: dTMP kinase [Patescibacteria group bacterium]